MGILDNKSVKYLKGIGEVRAKNLSTELNISTFRDLLNYFPTRHIDRSRFYTISELHEEMPYVQIRGQFVNFTVEGEGAKGRLKGAFSDGKRLMEVVWFSKINKLRDLYHIGVEYVLFGKPGFFNNTPQMVHPEIEKYNPEQPPEGFQGVYSLTEKMRRKGMSSRLFPVALRSLMESDAFRDLEETLPVEVINAYNLMGLRDAYREMHFPSGTDNLARARLRMKFEELFYLELNIMRFAMHRNTAIAGHFLPRVGNCFNKFYSEVLPFDLTGAQKRVLKEIRSDMVTGRQMNRLLQGDVGSGKTLVAFMTLLIGVDNGLQGSLMAPTEILASQHYETLKEWCEPLGISVKLLTGSTKVKERRIIHEGLQSGEIQILVGTHALLEEKVEFKNLGIAIIDEQHRFGVAQRARLWHKNRIPPHVLVMTATPIPRTLAMTVYGDLDVSVIDELPPGRKPIATFLRYDDNRMEINRLINIQLMEGRQIYIVYPLVRENPKLELKSVEEGFERITGLFPDVGVSMVHGQMSTEKKDREMEKFVSGENRIMVATTVIEVGVNVPNASVMIIENAERFGLSQLHQLRGRVGRGADKSYCILVTSQQIGQATRKRLRIMT
ncbi:MAG: ATP-dependent DNA helicase RecG, partial [Muribaculaceae bacterium]|nr:ATP-dependent DNA helicase RecG [Muribaculaceae bacterium]